MGQKILVVGSGAREHAIAHTLLKGASVDTVFCAPGNPGMQRDGIHITALSPSNHAALIDFATDNAVDWVFVGPEVPLIEGLVDDFEAAGIRVFGPTRAAAQIEGSKDFAKQLMTRHGIPTARYQSFNGLESAQAYVREHGAPVVIKADGLAAGKGVTVAMTMDEALHALDELFIDRRFGDAGSTVVVEDYLQGQEFSLMCFVRGTEFWPMPLSQDHKRAHDGDRGPNTGGMGAYSPLPQFGQDLVDQSVERIIRPITQAMSDESVPFTGILYAGLIATQEGPKVIEFNARLGDPETEVVLPRLTSDLGAGIRAILDGGQPEFTWRPDGATLGVVLASEGYPNHVVTGAAVPQLNLEGLDGHVYYAGVRGSTNGASSLTASSGRVLIVEASAASVREAHDAVYRVVDGADTTGLFYRHDIGFHALS